MKQDEFNSVEIKNEIHSSSFEFGRTPKESFSFKKENDINPRDEINTSNVYDEVSNGNDEHKNGESKHIEDDKKDIFKQSSNSSSASSSTASSSAASSSTASSVATVATAASVIAVTSVSVVAGITTLANQNASCRLLDFAIYKDKIEYALVIENAEADNFSLFVQSNTYTNSKKLEIGENRGEITGLSENATYSFIVKEEIVGGKTLLNQSFTTSKGEEPPVPVDPTKFNGCTFSKYADFEMQTFEITLDYVDPNNKMSNFEIYIKDKDMEEEASGSGTSGGDLPNYVTLSLEKTKETQTVSVNPREQESEYLVRLDDNLYIEISYYEDGNKVIAAKYDNQKFIQPSEFYDFGFYTDENDNPLISARNIFGYYLSYYDEEHVFKSAVLRLYAEKKGSLVPIQAEIPIEIVEYDTQYIDFARYFNDDELIALCSDDNSINMELIGTIQQEDGTTKEEIWFQKEGIHFTKQYQLNVISFDFVSTTISQDNIVSISMKVIDDNEYLKNSVLNFTNSYMVTEEFKYQYDVSLDYSEDAGIQELIFDIDLSNPVAEPASAPTIEEIKAHLALGSNVYFEYVDESQTTRSNYVAYNVILN